jgi:HEAT repeat protein
VRTLLGAVLLLACAALSAGAADVDDLIKKLGSKDNEARRAAAKDLGELGKEAKPATKALVKALRDEDRFVRRFAAQALGSIGPDASEAVPGLTALLNDDKPAVREAAVKALARLGPTAVPALMKALSGTADVQEVAINALGEAGKDGIPGLTSAIKNTRTPANLRRKAIEVLLPNDKDARSAIPALAQVVRKPGARGQEGRLLRIDAVNALGRLANGTDRAAVSALNDIVKDEKLRDMQLKRAATQALKKVQARK